MRRRCFQKTTEGARTWLSPAERRPPPSCRRRCWSCVCPRYSREGRGGGGGSGRSGTEEKGRRPGQGVARGGAEGRGGDGQAAQKSHQTWCNTLQQRSVKKSNTKKQT